MSSATEGHHGHGPGARRLEASDSASPGKRPPRTPREAGGGLFARLGRAVVYHPWRVIALWIVVAIAVIATNPGLPTTTNESSFLPSSYESIKAMNLQDQAFPQSAKVSPNAAIIVFARADGGKLTATDSAKVHSIAAELTARHITNIVAITAGPPSPNGLVQAATVAMPNSVVNGQSTAAGDAIKVLRSDIKPMVSGTGLTEGTTGAAAQQLDSQQSGQRAQEVVLLATLLLILILLLVIFRSPVIAIMPLILIAIVSQVADGLIADVNKAANLGTDSSIAEILIVVLFGVGTDYILFLMFRFRERLRSGESPKQAMVNAVSRAGEAIATAAGVVMVAFLALLLSSLSVLRAIGPALAIAVAVTLLAALTLVPAVVSLLGTRIFWPSKSWQREPKSARYAAMGRSLTRHPGAFAAVSGLVLVGLTFGALGFNATFDLGSSGIPANAESQVALKTLEKGFPPGATDPTIVLLHSNAPLSASELSSYQKSLKHLAHVSTVSPAKLSADSHTAYYSATLSVNPTSTAAVHAIGPIRDGAHAAAPPGSYALVGGTTGVFADIQRAVNHDYALVFPVAAAVILLMLMLMLRSLVAPWYLMASVGLGFGAALGSTVLLFQDIRGQSGLIFLLPVYIYVFVVALGTDYNILMISRLREEAREGLPPREAAGLALRHTGPTVGSAGLILAGTFGSLALAGTGILSQLGFAVSAGIVLAAFVMATFFTPSLTALIGRHAWWPGRLSHVTPASEVTVRRVGAAGEQITGPGQYTGAGESHRRGGPDSG
jgi:putative drug exporter of the RND superfamily